MMGFIMKRTADDQTQAIISYIETHSPDYLAQTRWSYNPLGRLLDWLCFGIPGRSYLQRGRNAADRDAIKLLTSAIATTAFRQVMGRAFCERADRLMHDLTDADTAIADLSLAIWCDPDDGWARKSRATIYHMCQSGYDNKRDPFCLPMIRDGALQDIAAAIDFFTQISSRFPDERATTSELLERCRELRSKLQGRTPRG